MAWLLVLALLAVGGAGLGRVLSQPSNLLTSSSSSQLVLQDTDSHLVWSSGWKVQSNGSASGGSVHVSGKAGASATLVYYGSYLKILAPTGRGAGAFRVTLDGATTTVSTHGNVFRAQRVVFAAGPAGDRHTLKIQVVGTPGHPYVSIDAVVISGSQAAMSDFRARLLPGVTASQPPDSTPTPDPTNGPTPTPASAPTPTPTPAPTANADSDSNARADLDAATNGTGREGCRLPAQWHISAVRGADQRHDHRRDRDDRRHLHRLA